jgi:hypothetical protein
MPTRQLGKLSPKVSHNFAVSSREFLGRLAGVGYASVATGVTGVVLAPKYAEQRELGSCSSWSYLIKCEKRSDNE